MNLFSAWGAKIHYENSETRKDRFYLSCFRFYELNYWLRSDARGRTLRQH